MAKEIKEIVVPLPLSEADKQILLQIEAALDLNRIKLTPIAVNTIPAQMLQISLASQMSEAIISSAKADFAWLKERALPVNELAIINSSSRDRVLAQAAKKADATLANWLPQQAASATKAKRAAAVVEIKQDNKKDAWLAARQKPLAETNKIASEKDLAPETSDYKIPSLKR